MGLHPLLWVLIFGFGFMALVVLISLIIGISVAIAGRSYSEKLQKSYQDKIRDMLPGKDCSACEYPTCTGYARAVMFGVAAENACPHIDEETSQKMLLAVKELQQILEDPKPIKKRKKRSLFSFLYNNKEKN